MVGPRNRRDSTNARRQAPESGSAAQATFFGAKARRNPGWGNGVLGILDLKQVTEAADRIEDRRRGSTLNSIRAITTAQPSAGGEVERFYGLAGVVCSPADAPLNC